MKARTVTSLPPSSAAAVVARRASPQVPPPTPLLTTYVYLYDGAILPVRDVASVRLDAESVILDCGRGIVSRFSRSDVYWCGHGLSCPAPC